MVQAGAVPETFFTVWNNVFERGGLKSGEWFMVHGGSSGIGTTAIQLARAFGATVYATAGSAHKCAACVELGAAAASNYREEDFGARIGQLTGGRGVDLILDMVMGEYLARNLQCLATDGRLVFIAVQGGPKVKELNVLPIMLKRLSVSGSTLRPRSIADKAAIANALREQVWPLLAAGSVAPVVHASFALERAAEAHTLMESSTHVGKIMLTLD
jgi:putative PIG3 family NAD(P)H quinone oxidoreductase